MDEGRTMRLLPTTKYKTSSRDMVSETPINRQKVQYAMSFISQDGMTCLRRETSPSPPGVLDDNSNAAGRFRLQQRSEVENKQTNPRLLLRQINSNLVHNGILRDQ